MSGPFPDDTYAVLDLDDVRRLRENCPEGLGITDVMEDLFLEQVRPGSLVLIMRVHEEADPDRPEVVRAVVLAGFTLEDGRPMIQEFACRQEDLAAAMRMVRGPVVGGDS